MTVNGPIDPNYPHFATALTIDGRKSTSYIHSRSPKNAVLKCELFDEEYLGFGPISSRSNRCGASSSITRKQQAGQVGTITVEVVSCKKMEAVKGTFIPHWKQRTGIEGNSD